MLGLLTQATGSQAGERQRFTGKPEDAGTGLHYFNARYYDPEVGRFTSVDPARDGLNWYVHAHSNPLKYVDPDGGVPILAVTGLIGALIGGGHQAYSSYVAEGYVNWGKVIEGAAWGGAIGLAAGASTSVVASTAIGGLSPFLNTSQTFAGMHALLMGGTAATHWGVSKDGINQGIKHFFELVKDPDRTAEIANRLGINPSMFENTKEGFRNFTNAALNIVNNYQSLGGAMRQLSEHKIAYYVNRVIIIMWDGKLQTVMPAPWNYFQNLK